MVQIGSYKVVESLGEGAFGRTFLGHHHLIENIKVCIKQEKTGDPVFQKLFKQEAEMLAKLRYPSLPVFLDYLEEGGDIGQVLVLSYIEGKTLDSIIKLQANKEGKLIAKKPIDDEHICWIIDRILNALSYLHGKHSIVHCDLKPQNVIVDIKEHSATVIDFGMASFKPVEFSKAKGGTPGYLPPEFGNGLPPIPAGDIYSVGKIVCCLSGGDPVKGEFAKDFHPKLQSFFEPWIRHDPTQRPQSTDKLRSELRKVRYDIFKRHTTREEFKYR